MTYLCIKCRAIWIAGTPTEDVSGGVCEKCIIEYIRAKQIKQGYDDCFKRAVEICNNKECPYHEICCKYLNGHEDYLEHCEI